MQFPLTIVCHTLTSSSYLNGIGRSPLPEREVSSLSPFPQSGPQARQKNYEWMSETHPLTSIKFSYILCATGCAK